MAGTGAAPRRGRLPPPISFNSDNRWPESAFPQVTDAGVRAALLAAQKMAFVVRKERGIRKWSQQKLASAADVDRDLVVTLENGTAWLQVSSVSRILAPLGAYLNVYKAKPPSEGA